MHERLDEALKHLEQLADGLRHAEHLPHYAAAIRWRAHQIRRDVGLPATAEHAPVVRQLPDGGAYYEEDFRGRVA